MISAITACHLLSELNHNFTLTETDPFFYDKKLFIVRVWCESRVNFVSLGKRKALTIGATVVEGNVTIVEST